MNTTTNRVSSFLEETTATILVRGRQIQTTQKLSYAQKSTLTELIEEFKVQDLNICVKSYKKAGFGNYLYCIESLNEKTISENLSEYINAETKAYEEDRNASILEAAFKELEEMIA